MIDKYRIESNGKHKLAKARTGIVGLDEILDGGFPRNRSSLITGGPGCGKSLLGQTFVAHGAADCNEPGLIVTFEESQEEILQNSGFLGFDLKRLIEDNKLFIDQVAVEPVNEEKGGQFNLGGSFQGSVTQSTRSKPNAAYLTPSMRFLVPLRTSE